MNKKLNKGQVILIKDAPNVVIGMIEFKEDTWVWQEYKLKDDFGRIKWLSVEEEDNKIKYSLYEVNNSIPKVQYMDFNYKNENYTLFEKGNAKVKSYFGNVDVDSGEKVEFSEYINSNKDKLISIENWSGEIEKSIGSYIDESDIKITDEIRKVPSSSNSNKGVIAFIVSFITFLSIIIVYFDGFFYSNKSMIKIIEKDSQFTYVTSITNNENNKKAKVYKTDLTIEDAAKRIIDGAPESIQKVNDNGDSDGGIGLCTKSEYAYIYKSEDDTTYVQVSKNNFVTSSTRAYRSRYRSNGYYGTYTTSSTNNTLSDYLSSARQQSINSRKSSGGGTSSGK